MTVAQSSPQPTAAPIGALYRFGVPIVAVFDAALALLVGFSNAHQVGGNDTLAAILGYTVGYAGCSLVFFLAVIVGFATLVARSSNRIRRPILMKLIFWSGLTWVPICLVLLAISSAVRHMR
jgi:hypothetical protein